LADKKAAKRRRRENKEAREKAKAGRTGPSPAQQAEAVRNVEAEDHGKPNAAPVWTARWEATPPATADRRSDTMWPRFDLACVAVRSGRDRSGRSSIV